MDDRIARLESELKHVARNQEDLKEMLERGQRETRDILKELSTAMTKLAEHQNKFDHINHEFEHINQKFEHVDREIVTLRDRTHAFGNHITSLEGVSSKLTESIERLVWRADQIEDRLLRCEHNAPDHLDDRLRSLESRIPLTNFINSIFFKIILGLIGLALASNVLVDIFK